METKPLACVGWDGHTWTLSVEEGNVALTTEPCGPTCDALDTLGDRVEDMTMPGVTVTLRMATECPAYDVDDLNRPTGPATPMRGYEVGNHYIAHGTRCDCNWWLVAEAAR